MTESFFLKRPIFGGMLLRLAATTFPQKSASSSQHGCQSSARSFSVAEEWIKFRGLCALGLPLDAFKQLSPQKR
jgi:hypothetical protein